MVTIKKLENPWRKIYYLQVSKSVHMKAFVKIAAVKSFDNVFILRGISYQVKSNVRNISPLDVPPESYGSFLVNL